MRTGVRQAGLLLDWQRIHIRTNPDAAWAVTDLQRADNAGPAYPRGDRVAPLLEPTRHESRGFHFFKRELGVLMNMLAQSANFVERWIEILDLTVLSWQLHCIPY